MAGALFLSGTVNAAAHQKSPLAHARSLAKIHNRVAVYFSPQIH
jgi:hypothetical protein